MTRIPLLICLLCCSLTVRAQKSTKYIFPQTSFDQAATARQMRPGTCAIKGTASLKKKGKVNFPAKGSSILLFPVTPYFSEFLELRREYNNAKKEATMSNEAFTYRVQGKFTDNQGSFEFNNIRPGRYYILTWISFEKRKNVSLQTGTSYSYSPTSNSIDAQPVYTAYTYGYSGEDEVGGFVEVTDGATVHAVISN
jgi:hypothetical protein